MTKGLSLQCNVSYCFVFSGITVAGILKMAALDKDERALVFYSFFFDKKCPTR